MKISLPVLGRLTDPILGYAQLSVDLLCNKIPPERLSEFVMIPLSVGRDQAFPYKGKNMETLCKENEIKIERAHTSGTLIGMRFRAKLTCTPGKCAEITVFHSSLQEIIKSSNNVLPEGSRLTYEQGYQMCLAHEFFHYLEWKKEIQVSQMLEPVETFRFLNFRRMSCINYTSEVAAHAFTKELLGIPHLPNLYDYVYLLSTGKMTEKYLIELADKCEKLGLGEAW